MRRFALYLGIGIAGFATIGTPAWAIKNPNEIAELWVASMPGAGSDPTFTRGQITRLEPLIRVDNSLLDLIDRYGFLNQHQTGTSHGSLDNGWRARAEYQFMGMKGLARGIGQPSEVHPKYGFLNFDARNPAQQGSHIASHYGDVIFVMAPSVFPRTSYCMTDSLGCISPVIPLSDLRTLEEQATRGGDRGEYIEIQVWGTFTLNDVTEIWIQHGIPGIEGRAKQLARKYGLALYRYHSGAVPGSSVRLSKVLIEDNSAPRPTTPAFVEPSISDLLARVSLASGVESRMISRLLVERGYRGPDPGPPIFGHEIPGLLKETFVNFTQLLFGIGAPPKIRLSGFLGLTKNGELWERWVDEAFLANLEAQMRDPAFLRELKAYFHDDYLEFVNSLMPYGSPVLDYSSLGDAWRELPKLEEPKPAPALSPPVVAVAPTPVPTPAPRVTAMPSPRPTLLLTKDRLESLLKITNRSEPGPDRDAAVTEVVAALTDSMTREMIFGNYGASGRLAHFVERYADRLPPEVLGEYEAIVHRADTKKEAHQRALEQCGRILRKPGAA